MKLEVRQEIVEIVEECSCVYGRTVDDGDTAEAKRYADFVKSKILDRWYRFARFGIESRQQLAGVSVTVEWVDGEPSALAERRRLDTRVSVAGTGLEAR